MQMRTIGSIPVSLAGVGCNNFGRRIDEQRSAEVVHAALEIGVNTFDTADLYGDGMSEEFLGRALGSHRDEAVAVSKFGMRKPPDGLTGGDPAWVPRACDATLTRLGSDHIDVYLLHQPDEATPIANTLGAMSRLVDAGKVREIGCSNFSGAQVEEAERAAADLGAHRFVVVQNEYSLLEREPEAEVLPACRKLALAFMPYFPLASGLLTGKYRRGQPAPPGSRLEGRGGDLTDERFAAVEKLAVYAEAHAHTLLELSLSWLASHPEVATVIAGATSGEQVRANAEATEAWQLTEQEFAEIDELLSESTAS
jgi:aryl-alcohol dehydrogenase-like predicted oxidoreductase